MMMSPKWSSVRVVSVVMLRVPVVPQAEKDRREKRRRGRTQTRSLSFVSRHQSQKKPAS